MLGVALPFGLATPTFIIEPEIQQAVSNRRQSQNDFANEEDSLRTVHFCTPAAYKNTLSPRKVFFPTYTPPGKTDLNLFSACGPKMKSVLSTV